MNNQWPLPKYSSAPADHLHALGVVTLNFNTFEFALFRLFSHHLETLKVDISVSWNLYSALQDNKKGDAIVDLYSRYEKNSSVINHVNHILAFFHRCSGNRNHLFHATHTHHPGDDLHLSSGVRREWNRVNQLQLSLPQIRSIADSMHDGFLYLWDVWAYLQRRDLGSVIHPFIASTFPTSLPDKPPLPVALNPFQSFRGQGEPATPPDALTVSQESPRRRYRQLRVIRKHICFLLKNRAS